MDMVHNMEDIHAELMIHILDHLYVAIVRVQQDLNCINKVDIHHVVTTKQVLTITIKQQYSFYKIYTYKLYSILKLK